MDNQAAMFTAQQMQYNKMYGMDPTRRMDELAAAQGSLNPRYGQHPWVFYNCNKNSSILREYNRKLSNYVNRAKIGEFYVIYKTGQCTHSLAVSPTVALQLKHSDSIVLISAEEG